MNWDAIGALGEIVGATAVVLTLVYLASQVRYAKSATLDQGRITRSNAVCEMVLATASDDVLREGQMRDWGIQNYYEELGSELGISSTEASRNDWANVYYFWVHWGQWKCTNDEKDLEELENIITTMYGLPGMRRSWDISPVGKALLEPNFVAYVDGILNDSLG